MSDIFKSYCRICQAYCGYEVIVEDGEIKRLRGDRNDPVSLGYACFKGLSHLEMYKNEKRLIRPLKKVDGGFIEDHSETVFREAGEKLREIIGAHGTESVGFWMGTQSLFNALSPAAIGSFAAALKTPKVFTTMTIDQSAKWIAVARMGGWQAGSLPFEEADVWLFAGSNPLTTMVAGGGGNQFAFSHPLEKMKRARERGMKLVVIDPRETETAKEADLHLQIIPGRDTEMAAALLHVIFRENWIDQEFCDQYINGLDELKRAVEPFSPEAMAPIVGVDAALIEDAAAIFARDNKKGMVGTGTGPNMARFSNTSEHLYQAINVVCGRFPREGDRVPNPGVLQPETNFTADVIPVDREWEHSPKSTVNGLGTIRGTMMSAEITNEMLHEGTGRLRAMIVVGGNLQTALPDQAKAERALSNLDLLIVIDPVLSGTAKFAHYVIPPKLHYERADHTAFLERMFEIPFSHATKPVVQPPEGSDVVDDWYALWRIAAGAGVPLKIGGSELDPEQPPTTEELLEKVVQGSRVPYEQVVTADQGAAFDTGNVYVGPRKTDAKFDVLPADVDGEIKQLVEQLNRPLTAGDSDDLFQVVVRRHKDMMNSTGTYFPSVVKRYKVNPIYMHPQDMARLSIETGEEVIISRDETRKVGGFVKADESLRQGIVAISHGWSGRDSNPSEATNRLIEPDIGKATINHMPVMTGYMANVSKVR